MATPKPNLISKQGHINDGVAEAERCPVVSRSIHSEFSVVGVSIIKGPTGAPSQNDKAPQALTDLRHPCKPSIWCSWRHSKLVLLLGSPGQSPASTSETSDDEPGCAS